MSQSANFLKTTVPITGMFSEQELPQIASAATVKPALGRLLIARQDLRHLRARCCPRLGGRPRTKCPLRVRTGLEIRYQRDAAVGRARLATWAPTDTFALRQFVGLSVVLYNFN